MTTQPDMLKLKAVEAAIKFLIASGANYTIEFGGNTFTNRKKRPDYLSVYGPLIKEAEDKGETTVSVIVPEEFEFENFRGAMTSQLIRQYGVGHVVTDVNREKRIVSALWIKGEV